MNYLTNSDLYNIVGIENIKQPTVIDIQFFLITKYCFDNQKNIQNFGEFIIQIKNIRKHFITAKYPNVFGYFKMRFLPVFNQNDENFNFEKMFLSTVYHSFKYLNRDIDDLAIKYNLKNNMNEIFYKNKLIKDI